MGTSSTALPRSTPEEQGVPSAAVLRMVRRWESTDCEPHGMVLLRHGAVVAEAAWQPWPRDGIRLVYSVSKTVLAIAVGLAESEGLLARGERLVEVFPESAAVAGARASRLTVEDCLRMSTGHRVPTLAERRDDPVAALLAAEPEEEPRSWFLYHNAASRVLAIAVQRRTGQRLVDYLRPRLFDPLGIERAVWTTSAGTDLGHSGLHVTTEALARLGLLLLWDGRWQDGALLPDGWVSTASSPLADTAHHPDPADWNVGYGHQLWRSRHGFRADGAYGQFALVVPEHDLVLAITACTETPTCLLEAVWEELLPCLGAAPLPPGPQEHADLLAALRDAAAPAGRSLTAPPGDGPWAFRHTPTEEHPLLRSVTVSPAGDPGGWLLDVVDGEPLSLRCGDGWWPDAVGSPWVASGGWVEPGVFEATVVAHETPHSLRLRCSDAGVTARWRAEPLHTLTLSRLRAPAG